MEKSCATKTNQGKKFAAKQIRKLKYMGFSYEQVELIMDVTGPGLAVQCVEWTLSVFNKFNEKLSTEKSILKNNFLVLEEIDFRAADQASELSQEMLQALPGLKEPLGLFSCFSIGKMAFPSTKKLDSQTMLNGAIEAVRYLPGIRVEQRATRGQEKKV
jgi:hypothetical protein